VFLNFTFRYKHLKNKNLFKFEPKKELWFVVMNYLAIVLMFYLSFQIITIQHVAAQFITFGVLGVLILGILTPAIYNTLIKKRPLSEIGIHQKKLVYSLGLCLVFTVIQYFLTLRNVELPSFTSILPLIFMVITVGYFENIFFRGYAQNRFEESFGIIPAILLSTIIYTLYHVGYGMLGSEYGMLFIVGLTYSIIFRITKNIFILFPLLTPMGALYTNIKEELSIPLEAIIGFSMVIVCATLCLIYIHIIWKKKINKTSNAVL